MERSSGIFKKFRNCNKPTIRFLLEDDCRLIFVCVNLERIDKIVNFFLPVHDELAIIRKTEHVKRTEME